MVSVDEPVIVAAAEIVNVVALFTTVTVAPLGMPVPVTVCPAPICVVDATVTVVVEFNVAAIVNIPIALAVVVPITLPRTGVFALLLMSDRF